MQPFLKESVDPTRPDGYWIEAFPFDAGNGGTPDLIGYGLGTSDASSKIQLYLNPVNAGKPPNKDVSGWDKIAIADLQFPVACSVGKIAGSNFNDVIVSDKYGPSMNDIWADGGRVSWYENKGDRDPKNKAYWPRRYIGKSPAMHRLKVGHFNTNKHLQIIAIPVIPKSKDLVNPVPVIIYTAPEKPLDAKVDDDSKGWPSEIAFSDKLRIVHEVVIAPGLNNGLDVAVVASREGISTIWYNTTTCKWEYENLGTGLPETSGNPYWGSGSVALGKVKSDTTGYIACAEAFHGNHVSVYVKDSTAPPNKLAGVKWTRHLLTDFGPLNDQHTGSIHEVVTTDIDGDGVDEILVALMGSDPPSWEKTGVWCYKPIDLSKGEFARFKLSNDSAGRIAVGELTKRGLVDFGTISYSVPNYFESPNPAVNVYASSPITAEKLGDEVLFRVPRPISTKLIDEVEFLDVSSRKLGLVVVPPNTKYHMANGDGVKVILGLVSWEDAKGSTNTRTQATDPFSAISTVVESKKGYIEAGPEGAIFTIFKKSTTSGKAPYSDMKQLVAHNLFPERFSSDIRNMSFPWVKVEDRPWANGRFKGLEFYNLVGFHVRLADDSDAQLCHIQLWTAGLGVSAGFHNHTGEVFCEIHACIVNGTGKGGMYWATVPDDQFNAPNPQPGTYKGIVVGDMSEHGPLWRTARDGIPERRVNGTVDYPWHAWVAGDGTPGQQSFDVWAAFELTPFLANLSNETATLKPEGKYKLTNEAYGYPAVIKDGDSTDGALIIGQKNGAANEWELAHVPGTKSITLQNVKSTSFAASNWPPVDGQQLVGSRYIAVLGVTSSWIPTKIHDKDYYNIWLIGTELVWTLNNEGNVALKKHVPSDTSQHWQIQ